MSFVDESKVVGSICGIIVLIFNSNISKKPITNYIILTFLGCIAHCGFIILGLIGHSYHVVYVLSLFNFMYGVSFTPLWAIIIIVLAKRKEIMKQDLERQI